MIATEKIYKLMWQIKEDYSGIIPKEDINAINSILLNTIKSIKEEEQQLKNESELNSFESILGQAE
jgi:site-specific DNA-adenine methylase